MSAVESHRLFVAKLLPELAQLGVVSDGGGRGDELQEQLEQAFESNWQSVEDFELSQAELCSYVAEKLRLDLIEEGKLDSLVAELMLALACARGHQRALRDFEKRYFGSVAPALRRMKLDDAAIDEVTQMLREKIFVPSEAGGLARIAELAGNGDLRALLRVTAVRIALNLKRKDKRIVGESDEAMIEALAPDSDPELSALKARYRGDVKAAFEKAIGELEAKDRTVLRLHLLHGLSIDEIGEMYRVHRATAARWLSRVRGQLEKATRRGLQAQLGVNREEFQSMIRLVQSRLDVSFDRLLASVEMDESEE